MYDEEVAYIGLVLTVLFGGRNIHLLVAHKEKATRRVLLLFFLYVLRASFWLLLLRRKVLFHTDALLLRLNEKYSTAVLFTLYLLSVTGLASIIPAATVELLIGLPRYTQKIANERPPGIAVIYFERLLYTFTKYILFSLVSGALETFPSILRRSTSIGIFFAASSLFCGIFLDFGGRRMSMQRGFQSLDNPELLDSVDALSDRLGIAPCMVGVSKDVSLRKSLDLAVHVFQNSLTKTVMITQSTLNSWKSEEILGALVHHAVEWREGARHKAEFCIHASNLLIILVYILSLCFRKSLYPPRASIINVIFTLEMMKDSLKTAQAILLGFWISAAEKEISRKGKKLGLGAHMQEAREKLRDGHGLARVLERRNMQLVIFQTYADLELDSDGQEGSTAAEIEGKPGSGKRVCAE